MKILVALTYYRPHVSGLTIYVERLARGLSERGHLVTVLTSRHDPALPRRELLDGVRVVRVPVAFRVNKGAVAPASGPVAAQLAREHDVLSVHLPHSEGWMLALAARGRKRPCILTYHCDLQLPDGAWNRVVDRVTFAANLLAARSADRVVAYTHDFADHSPFLRRCGAKVEVVHPPVEMRAPASAEVEAFRARHGLRDSSPVLGLAARLAAEKGVDVVLDALPALQQRFPRLKVLFAGPASVPGEEAYRARLEPGIARLGDRWRFVGTLDPREEMPSFYGAVDCLLVPSVNSTESFGLVQVEAMLCGTPVVASALPGVREAVRLTGMGEVVPVGDAAALADAVTRVLSSGERYVRPREEIARLFALESCIERYEELFERELARSR